MSDPKPVRTLEMARHDLSQAAHQAGLLEFQMQREIPTDLEKLYNHMHDLNRECQNLYRKGQEAAAKEQMNGKDHLKVVEPEAPAPAPAPTGVEAEIVAVQ